MLCRALRESRGMTQPGLAEIAGMSQPRISEMERPGERKPNLETLLRLASAFDVALDVRFVPFSDFVDANNTVDLDNLHIPNFDDDMRNLATHEERIKQLSPFKSRIENQAGGTQHFEIGGSLARKAAGEFHQSVSWFEEANGIQRRGDSNAA